MTKTTHTHRGTCQVCGHIQAVANGAKVLAAHGYTKEWGYFSGTCTGSDKRPAELDVSITKATISWCYSTAPKHDAAVACLKDGSSVPNTFERYNRELVNVKGPKGGWETLPIAQADAQERAHAIKLAIHREEQQAKGLRDHAKGLEQHVLTRLGQPLYPVSDFAPKAKPAAPTVDVKAAKVTGAFATKAARKEALEKLSRQYSKLRDQISNAYLNGNREAPGAMDLYYAAHELHQWRVKHSEVARRLYPELANVVTEIEQLVAAREAVKAAP